MSKKVKIFALVIVGIAIIIAAMTFLGGKAPKPTTTGLSTTSSPIAGAAVLPGSFPPGTVGVNAAAANDFSALLSSINSISIDTSLFTNPAYKALRDYPVVLGSDIVGRVNPFAPVGTDIGDSGSQVSLDIQTLAPGKITSSTAELGALVTLPDSVPVSVVFQYGVSDTFGSSTSPITTTKSGTALVTISGLKPSTTYMVQAVAARGSSTAQGTTVSFTTTASAGVPAGPGSVPKKTN